MKIELFLILVLIIVISFFIYYIKNDIIYVKSDIDGQYYLVKNDNQKQISANIIAKLKQNTNKLINYVIKHEKQNEYYKYFIKLKKKMKTIKIIENVNNYKYTSYSVNKGEELVLCLKSKKTFNYHDENLLMYVILHEISHILCPEYGHTQLFKNIFHYVTKISISIGIYNKIEFHINPHEYCGMVITNSII